MRADDVEDVEVETMSTPEQPDDLDPAEVAPTDNSTGAPVDPERLADVEHGAATAADEEQPSG